jgi:hypothetical protein
MPKKSEGPIAAPGRKFIVMGPLCWGEGRTEAEAVRHARENFSPYFGGTWQYIVFDAHETVEVDDMGCFCYYPERIPAGQGAYDVIRRVGFVTH